MMTKQRKLYATRHKIGGGVELEVCYRDDRFGKGPCFSVYDHKREMLRFDLFETNAHWHDYREHGQPRHYFDPREARGERATVRLFEDAIKLATSKYPGIDAARPWLWPELVKCYRRAHVTIEA